MICASSNTEKEDLIKILRVFLPIECNGTDWDLTGYLNPWLGPSDFI
jgi:hypothetical protein